ncbi:MAG: sigma 54-interacting transcriptional regulator [Vicinamibacterales bacterium]
MADTTFAWADARAARLARQNDGALELIGRSPAITRAQELVRRAAALDGSVLMTAEAGVSVESVAREVHARSRHAAGAYVVVECAAREPLQLERLLFGTTVADGSPDLESVSSESHLAGVQGGTLFLQDVTELSAAVQARLARVARDGEMMLDGRRVATLFRLVASASPGIETEVHGHRFRADLYRRLATVRIDLPPLRERAEDVPALAERLLESTCAARGLPPRTLTHAALALLGALTWTGNLAELQAAIERAVTEAHDAVIQVEHLLPALQLQRAPAPFVPAGNLREARLRFEREYIASVLQHHQWRIADAAHTLGIQRPNLYRKARQLGIPVARLTE